MNRLALVIWLVLDAAAAFGQVSFKLAPKGSGLQIALGAQPIANYTYAGDVKISRPFFHKVRLPGGPQLTRNHPPIPGKDATDHDTMHPGIWLAFGDVNGEDTWRNKAYVRHDRF